MGWSIAPSWRSVSWRACSAKNGERKKKQGEAPRLAERLKEKQLNLLLLDVYYHGTFIASYFEGYQQYTFRIQGSVKKKMVKLKAQARATMNVSRENTSVIIDL